MDFHAIVVRSPINRTAASVVSQKNASTFDSPLSRAELIYLIERLNRKQRLLKFVLGIKNKSQHKNVKYRTKRAIPQRRQKAEPRALTEYMRNGQHIQLLVKELAEWEKRRKAIHAARFNPTAPQCPAPSR